MDDKFTPRTPRGGRSDRDRRGGSGGRHGGYNSGGGNRRDGRYDNRGGGGSRRDFGEPLPDNLIIKDSFYDGNYLKRSVFIGEAEQAAEFFKRNNMTQTSFRNLFNKLKAMALRLKAEKDLEFGAAQQCFYEFVRQVDYQIKREVIKCEAFVDFVKAHEQLATRDKREFIGFVEYLTSIMARLKQK